MTGSWVKGSGAGLVPVHQVVEYGRPITTSVELLPSLVFGRDDEIGRLGANTR
jgi:hypothetical protein